MLLAEDESKELLEYLLHNKNAYSNLLKFTEGLNLVDQSSKNVQKAINNSTATDLKINAQRAEKNIAPLTVRNIVDKPATTDSYSQMMVVIKNELGNYLEQESIKAAKVDSPAAIGPRIDGAIPNSSAIMVSIHWVLEEVMISTAFSRSSPTKPLAA